ncbi:MAG: MoaD/ThiS family protein [Granulosicoccus sp.]|nr:MoaD/ThiS family protein [Granulosicoccus sp.]
MATVVFTQNLRRHVDVERVAANGTTVNEVLGQVFEQYPRLRGYLLDDTGAARTHIALLVDGQSITDRQGLSDPVAEDSKLFVVQALSGG